MVELSQRNVFDAVFFTSNPLTDPNATSLPNNIVTGALNNGLILRFIHNPNISAVVDPVLEPAVNEQAVITNNFALVNGQTPNVNNPNKYHVANGVIVDAFGISPNTGEGPVASNAGNPTNFYTSTSTQTIRLNGNLAAAPRDGNLFVITGVQAGQGDSTFRVSGAAVTDDNGNLQGQDTNNFKTENLGFKDKVSLSTGAPGGPGANELPFTWGQLPNQNVVGVLNYFTPLAPLAPPPATFDTFRDFRFR